MVRDEISFHLFDRCYAGSLLSRFLAAGSWFNGISHVFMSLPRRCCALLWMICYVLEQVPMTRFEDIYIYIYIYVVLYIPMANCTNDDMLICH